MRKIYSPTATISPVSSSTGMESKGETIVPPEFFPTDQCFSSADAHLRAQHLGLKMKNELLVSQRAF
ncbi:MAG: hypothetical protein HRU17_00980 [Polyangiaceae bacterium]|nr:hypothetical protein [Polyangiaceae bacterium]